MSYNGLVYFQHISMTAKLNFIVFCSIKKDMKFILIYFVCIDLLIDQRICFLLFLFKTLNKLQVKMVKKKRTEFCY